MASSYHRAGICKEVVATCVDESKCAGLVPRWFPFVRDIPWLQAAFRSRRRGFGTSDRNRYWLNLDPCGVICAILVYSLEFGCSITILSRVVYPIFGFSFMGFFHGIVFSSLVCLSLLCHLRTMISNPGAVPFNSKPTQPDGWNRSCYSCQNFKPIRAHHCSICGRCVVKMDHHCPWVNNCVGMANHKYFLLFLLYTFLLCLYAIGLLIHWFISCASVKECSFAKSGPVFIIVSVIAALFMLFTCCLGMDQSSVLLTNQTQIDRLKEQRSLNHMHNTDDDNEETSFLSFGSRKKGNFWGNLAEVVGGDPKKERFQIHWLLPTAIKYENPEQLTGYCFRNTPKPRTLAEMEQV